MRVLIGVIAAACLSSLVIANALAAQTLQILPDVGQSQTFSVSSVLQMPGLQLPPGSESAYTGPGESPNQHGTLVIKRTAVDATQLTATGALKAIDQSISLNDKGALNSGSSSNIFVTALHNAVEIFSNMPAGEASVGQKWDATIDAIGYQNLKQPITVNVVVTKASRDTFEIEAKGKGGQHAGPSGVDNSADITAKITSGRLTDYEQKVVSTVTSPMGGIAMGRDTTFQAK